MSSINRRLTENLRDYYTTGMGGMSRLIFAEAWHLHTMRLYGWEPAAYIPAPRDGDVAVIWNRRMCHLLALQSHNEGNPYGYIFWEWYAREFEKCYKMRVSNRPKRMMTFAPEIKFRGEPLDMRMARMMEERHG